MAEVAGNKENFDAYAGKNLAIGTPLASGFTLLKAGATVGTSNYEAGAYGTYAQMKSNGTVEFTVGATSQIEFVVYDNTPFTGNARHYVTFYAADGVTVLATQYWNHQVLNGVSSAFRAHYKAPAGQLIGKVVIHDTQGEGIRLDDVSWGNQAYQYPSNFYVPGLMVRFLAPVERWQCSRMITTTLFMLSAR